MLDILKGISTNQFVAIESPIHSLDPRTKIVSLFLLILSIFFINNLWGYIWIFSYLLLIIFLSKLSIFYLLKWIKSIWFLIFIGAFFQLFTVQGKILMELGKIRITDNGVMMAIYISLRLIAVVLLSAVLTLTTSPIKLTSGIEKLLTTLFISRRVAHEFSMTVTIALRFIPTIAEEAERIMKSQMARGVRFDDKRLSKRIRSLLSVIIPLFYNSFRKAEELAVAMEARCYRGHEGRTRYHELKYQKRDFAVYLSSLTIAIFSILS